MRIRCLLTLFVFAVTFFRSFAQLPDSTKSYVWECINVMQHNSLYAKNVDWNTTRDSVTARLNRASTIQEAESIVIWVFDQLKDHHGMYGGIDTSYRYKSTNPERKFSDAILAEYKKPRSVKIQMLPGNIAYYKMPAVIIGSDTKKMKEWANTLMDSFCRIASQKPKAFIIDLRMNNGGNSEPMWQTLRFLAGDNNRVRYADANGKVIEDSDTAIVRYRQAGMPDRLCTFDSRVPVAVLIGPGTASSGEIMALSFRTRKKTRLFGEPTIGVANATEGFIVQNKGYLLLTVAYVVDAKKRLLKEMYVRPDVLVKNDGDDFVSPEKDATVKKAMAWLLKKI